MKNLFTRSISGLLFVIIIAGCIFIHPITFYILSILISILGIIEFNKLSKATNKLLMIISSILLITSAFVDCMYNTKEIYLLFFLSITLIPILELYRKNTIAISNISATIFGIIYISLPFTLLFYMPQPEDTEWFEKAKLIFLPFILIWINDTFAYLFGVSFGRRRLFESISPKKSWEGFIGGLASTIIMAYLISPYIPILKHTDTIIIAFITVIFGTYGDLIESKIKRDAEVKDSSNLIPGHGGILDRFDSLLFAVPVIYIYMIFII